MKLNVPAALVLSAISCSSLATSEFGTPKEAEALVAKAVAHVKAVGRTQAMADFTERKPGWVDRDLYVTGIDLQGNVLAHGANAKMVGKNLIELKDAAGKEFIREMAGTAKSKDKYWLDYQWTDAVTKKVLPKSMYCERHEDMAVCSGVYKR